ncbi:reverse transcriptase domain-containing protein [Tanacetum coccineum]
MAERTMEELLCAPTKGYGEAIVIPEINADHFKIKTNLLQLVQASPFHGFERENPHTHINNFKRITLTLKFRDVPNDVIKLMIEAWERFKEMLRACPHHGFTELTQIDTFYNGLNENDQDSLNAAAGGNILSKTTREVLNIIENKSKVRYSRNKSNVSRMNMNSRESSSKTDERIDKLADQISTLVEIVTKKVVTLATVKAVEEPCVTCGGAHAYYNCPNTDSNQSSVCAAMGTYNQVAPPNRVSNHMAPPGFAPVQNSQNRYNQNQGQGNNFNRENNFHGNQGFQAQINHAPNFQNQGFQNQPFQVPNNQVQQGIPNEFSSYMKANESLMRNMQSQINELRGSFFQNQASTSGTLLSNTIPNPKGEMKAITTRSGVAYEGPSIPTNPSPKKIDPLLILKDSPKTSLSKLESSTFLPTLLLLILKPIRALIDVYGEEITLRVDNEAVTFNLDQTTRYSSTYDDMSINRIDVIDVACEEYSQEVLGFSNNSSGGKPTTTFEPIISNSFLSITPFEESDFILEEIEAFLKDDSISPEIDHAVCDPEGDICLIKKLLNNDPFQLPSIDLKEVTKAKSSIEEPPELELKDLPSHLEYAYLEGTDLPVIIAKGLKDDKKEALLKVLKSHKRAIAWKITDIKGIDPRVCTNKILMEEDYKPTVQSQRWVNPKIHEVIKKEVIKLLNAGMIYPISDSPWVSPIHCVPKKGGITVVANEENELIPTRLVTGWRVCIDYRKLNEATRKDHFPLPFMDQMLERLAGNEFYCFLDGFSGYFQIPIDPQDQEKTTFTCPYGTFAYRRMPFGLCNAPGTFQRCMMAIFHDMIEKTMEVFMDDFSVFGDSFATCLSNLDNMLKRCEDTNLVLNWEKCHFMCKEGIVLGHKISKSGIEVDRAKVDVIAKLPHPTTVKGVRSFLGHAGFYRRFIQDFSKIARPMTHLLEKETPFVFSKDCIDSFETLKKKLTEAPILVVPDWNLPFELMCDASDFAIGAVLGQRKTKHFQAIHYASKTMTEVQIHYTTTEKEMLVVVLIRE